MNAAKSSAKYHPVLVTTLLKSITTRSAGILENLHLLQPSIGASPRTTNSQPFSEQLYIIAAAMDPNYGFVWLDADHSGSDVVKSTIKQSITGI
jgi:hypothetical protein